MRPIKLAMQAFGPYAGKETINFSQLGNRTMFVISGKTGAGKTTIFDAISYAIYGKASGEDRTGTDLRSQFADPDVLTEVSLEFSLRGKKYSIVRTPQQERKKERGDGTRTLPATALLYTVDGQGESKLIASKITEVDEKIKEIMLIDSNQFRQILMIPQGEFRKLLTSDSKEKEVILQRLFHTQLYKLVEEKLRAEAQDLKKRVEDRIDRRNDALKRIQAVFIEELRSYVEAGSINDTLMLPLLADEINAMTEEIDLLTGKIAEKRREQDKLKQDVFAAEAILKQIKDKEETEARNKQLAGQKEIYLGKERQIQLARKAALLASQEELCHRLKKEVDTAKDTSDRLNENLVRLTELKEAREKALETEKNREQQREDALALVNKLLNMKDDVYSFATVQKELQQAERIAKQKKDQIVSLEVKLKTAQETEKALLLQKGEIDRAKIEKVENERRLEKTDYTLGRLAKLETFIGRSEKAARENGEKETLFKRAEETLGKIRAEVASLEEKWLKGQASILAGKLSEGDPCPVCGAEQHPAPAHHQGGDVPDENELKLAKQQASKAEQEKAKAETAYLASKANLERCLEEVKTAQEELEEAHPAFKEEGIKIFTAGLQAERDLIIAEKAGIERKLAQAGTVEKHLADLDSNRLSSQKELEECRGSAEELAVKAAEYKTQLARMAAVVPEGLRSIPVYENAVREAKEKKDQLIRQYEAAQKSCQEAAEKVMAESARLKDAIEHLTRKQRELAEERESFKSQMHAQGFETYSAYEMARLPEREIDKLEVEVRAYNEEVRVCAERLAELSGKLEGKARPDMETLTSALGAIGAEIDELQKLATDLYLKKNQNEDVKKQAEVLNKEMKSLEQRYQVVGHLSDIAKGQNTYRLTFERYVLAAFLDDILREANRRLSKMTSGRFQLRRKTDRSKGNVQSGLELLVLDQYTAQERHVKTLSGGESFKAALSLALGLADVVQANAGGVSLETMFIDEGFGTLDPESLEQAIDALIDIQSSGRLVGIISHVPELKERIDARLEVTSTQAGSKAAFVVGV